ncbi:hypothetical protein PENFLA_c028G06762 [Penicillium flavigenum]|uniref:Uncharacterized protein n=1 Tax=Penicillium flavigenum TaxID=254877 RepID=A0A1V6SQJ3_9EURO|nr:hypothetical protein PENFLA_c028G06762 [Penicillium flavigenum]
MDAGFRMLCAYDSAPQCFSQWPTVVLEVGVSESYQKLRADADWWFANLQGAVKVVIIVTISQKKEEEEEKKKKKNLMITFETIILDRAMSLRPLPHLRRRYKTITRQKITTSREPGRSEHSAPITVCSDESLLIKFEEAFARQPIPPELDLLLEPDQLRTTSRHFWEVRNLVC